MRSGWVDIALLLAPKQVPAAAAPFLSSLLCHCSIATAACIWYIDFLPPTLFGASCRCSFLISQCFRKICCGSPSFGPSVFVQMARWTVSFTSWPPNSSTTLSCIARETETTARRSGRCFGSNKYWTPGALK